MAIIFFWIVLSLLIASVGSKRQIGYFKSLLISLVLSPLIGLIAVLLSEKDSDILNQLKIQRDAKIIGEDEFQEKVREIIPTKEDKKDTQTGFIILIIIGLIIYLLNKGCAVWNRIWNAFASKLIEHSYLQMSEELIWISMSFQICVPTNREAVALNIWAQKVLQKIFFRYNFNLAAPALKCQCFLVLGTYSPLAYYSEILLTTDQKIRQLIQALLADAASTNNQL